MSRLLQRCPAILAAAILFALIVAFLGILPGQQPAQPARSETGPASKSPQEESARQKEVASQRKEVGDRLRLARFPSWATDTFVGILWAREHPEYVQSSEDKQGSSANGQQTPTRQDPERIVPEDKLFALDAEMDLLASALLALREPDAVLTLYYLWYNDQVSQVSYFSSDKSGTRILEDFLKAPTLPSHWRTPAAPLLIAQAYRLRAWQQFFPRPDQTYRVAESSRVDLFFKANADLAKAASVLESALGKFRSPFEPKAESLARWASFCNPAPSGPGQQPPGGLPKPRCREDVQAGPKKPALINNAPDAHNLELRVPLPAFRTVEFVVSYQEWLCRIYRELGDLVYRETGQSAVARNRGENAQSTALGWYSLARDHCYAGRMIDYGHRGLRIEARDLSERLDWILARRAFGGHELLRLAPLSARNYLTPALRHLDVVVGELGRLQEKDAERTAGQLAVATDLQQRMADRKQLDQFYRAQAQRELTAGIMDLKSKLATFRGQLAREEVERAESDLQNYLLESSLGLSQQQYLGELERLQNQWLHQMLEAAQQLQINGGFQDASEITVAELELPNKQSDEGARPGLMSRMPEIDKPDPAAIASLTQFFDSLPLSPTQRELLNTWHRTLHPRKNPEIPRTTTAVLYAQWRAADLERDRRNLLWSIYKTKIELREQNKRLERLQADAEENKQQLGDLWTRFKRKETEAFSELEAKQLETVIKPKLQEEVQHASRHLHRAINELKNYQQKLAQVRKAVEDIKKAREKVQQAYESFVGLIQAAKSIPTTVAAGMATGTMFDAGEAIARGAEAVMQKLNAVLSGQISAEQLEAEVNNAEKTVADFLGKVDAVEKELRTKKADLDKATGKALVLADYQPGGKVHAQFKEEERRLNETKKELESEVRKTEKEIVEAQQFVDAGDDRELEISYLAAVANGRAALGRLVGAYDQRDQLLGKLQSIKSQWEGVARERQAAEQLVADVRRGLGERKHAMVGAREAWAQSRDERKALLPEIQAAILAFDAERRELLKPAHRMMTTELLEAMAPALALASLNPLPQEQQTLLDSANEDLVTAARWLYLLTGQERMAALGAPCQSLYELKLARKELAQVWQEFRDRMSAAKLQTCMVTFDKNDLKDFAGRLVFQTRAAAPSTNGQRVSDQRLWLLGASQRETAGPVWQYSHPQVGSDGFKEFCLTHAARQAGSLLHGVWCICEWEQPEDRAKSTVVVENLPDAYPNLRRVGLPCVRNGTQLVRLPFYTPAGNLPDPAALAAFSTREDVRHHALRVAGMSQDLISVPLIDPLANRYFGHGLDQTWVFELPTYNPESTRQNTPAWRNLQKVHIVLTYLVPSTGLARVSGTADLPGGPDKDFLTFLDDPNLQPALPGIGTLESIADARKHAAAALRSYRDSRTPDNLKAAQAALEKLAALTKQEHDYRAAAQSALANGIALPQNDKPDAGPASSMTSIVQPISIATQVAEANALLRLLEESLRTDYLDPLRKAAENLDSIRGHRKRLQELAEKLREQNEHRQVLSDYVSLLEQIVQTLRGEDLTAFERARLDMLLDSGAMDREAENILWTKTAQLLESEPNRKKVVEYLLEKINQVGGGSEPGKWGNLPVRRTSVERTGTKPNQKEQQQ